MNTQCLGCRERLSWHCDICHQTFTDGDALGEHVSGRGHARQHYMAYSSGGKYVAVKVEGSPIPLYRLGSDFGPDVTIQEMEAASYAAATGQLEARPDWSGIEAQIEALTA